jgi:SNF2 family DNA or RNA helicase
MNEKNMEPFEKIVKAHNLNRHTYQIRGIRWLMRKDKNRGGILADEMGLGKTLQTIGLLVCNQVPKTLLVLPLVLIDQWYDSLTKYTDFKVLIFHKNYLKHDVVLDNYDVVIVNSNGLSSNNVQSIFWNRCVVDEAHNFRNPKTVKSFNLCKLRRKSTILLTGTVINNRFGDLSTLFSYLGVTIKEKIKNKNDLIREHVLRRTQKAVGIKVPNMKVNYKTVSWQKTNKMLNVSGNYHKHLGCNADVKFIERGLNEEDRLRLRDKISGGIPLKYYMKCRQLCVRPTLLVDAPYGHDVSMDVDCKLDVVLKDVLRCSVPRIVFCNFIQEMEYIRSRCKRAGLKCAVVNGKVKKNDRVELLKKTWDVLVLQIRTCSEGLNLQNYGAIYFTSVDWNPALESQAIARSVRQGQLRETVEIHRYVMDNVVNDMLSVESYIMDRQKIKKTEIHDVDSTLATHQYFQNKVLPELMEVILKQNNTKNIYIEDDEDSIYETADEGTDSVYETEDEESVYETEDEESVYETESE